MMVKCLSGQSGAGLGSGAVGGSNDEWKQWANSGQFIPAWNNSNNNRPVANSNNNWNNNNNNQRQPSPGVHPDDWQRQRGGHQQRLLLRGVREPG